MKILKSSKECIRNFPKYSEQFLTYFCIHYEKRGNRKLQKYVSLDFSCVDLHELDLQKERCTEKGVLGRNGLTTSFLFFDTIPNSS